MGQNEPDNFISPEMNKSPQTTPHCCISMCHFTNHSEHAARLFPRFPFTDFFTNKNANP